MAGNGDCCDSTDRPAEHKDEIDRSIPEQKYKALLEQEYYDMSGARRMIIFNHFQYDHPYPEIREKVSWRHGTDVDVAALKKTGETLKFDVKDYDDRTHDQIVDIIDALCMEDHTGTSCVCVCILTHGWRGGVLLAKDRTFKLADIVNKLQDHAPGLVGKPKLLVVQACRGGLLDAGKAVRLDGPGDMLLLPSHIDTLVLRSCVEDYRSFRNGGGSWLVQEFCRVLDAKHDQLDLMPMIEIVTKLVAVERTSKRRELPALHNKKQTPETISTLIKSLRFTERTGV